MRSTRKSAVVRNKLPIQWQDCTWSPQVIILPSPKAFSLERCSKFKVRRTEITHSWRRSPTKAHHVSRFTHHASRITHHSGFRTPHSAFRTRRGFTLIELLVVIAIIAIIAAMVLPAIFGVKTRAKIMMAKTQMGQIVAAIAKYEADLGRMPTSTNAAMQAAAAGVDFTFGTYNLTAAAPDKRINYQDGSTPADIASVPPPSGTVLYKANNSEVMAILLDLETFGDGTPTVNYGHVRNPQKEHYLSANMAGDMTSPGVGLDGVYRDPWGNPYIISLDLNSDEKCRDSYYCDGSVSILSTTNLAIGINGLIQSATGSPRVYEANRPIMVWSAGPDRMVEQIRANNPPGWASIGADKDNILSWK